VVKVVDFVGEIPQRQMPLHALVTLIPATIIIVPNETQKGPSVIFSNVFGIYIDVKMAL